MQRGNDSVNQYRVIESRIWLRGGVVSVHSWNFSPILCAYKLSTDNSFTTGIHRYLPGKLGKRTRCQNEADGCGSRAVFSGIRVSGRVKCLPSRCHAMLLFLRDLALVNTFRWLAGDGEVVYASFRLSIRRSGHETYSVHLCENYLSANNCLIRLDPPSKLTFTLIIRPGNDLCSEGADVTALGYITASKTKADHQFVDNTSNVRGTKIPVQ